MTEMLTIQDGIKSSNADMTKYALFMGGTNVTNEVLSAYDPLKTGYARLFMVRKPLFVDICIPDKMKRFKHILEYGNTQIGGLSDVQVDFQSITGGYVGKSFEIPSVAQDGTTGFNVTVYEFSGSPIREVIHTWINGTTDLLTGLTHYNGVSETDVPRSQANQTAEFIYVNTDSTGEKIEYACLLANCFPKGINIDAFNYQSGEHRLVETNVEFTCTKYESIQINKVAEKLLSKYKILANSLNFYSGYNIEEVGGVGFGYNPTTGLLDENYSKYTNVPGSV